MRLKSKKAQDGQSEPPHCLTSLTVDAETLPDGGSEPEARGGDPAKPPPRAPKTLSSFFSEFLLPPPLGGRRRAGAGGGGGVFPPRRAAGPPASLQVRESNSPPLASSPAPRKPAVKKDVKEAGPGTPRKEEPKG